MKPKGFIYFRSDEDEEYPISNGEWCKSKKEMMQEYNNDWDDKWDVEGRQEYHYFYLDLSTGQYHPLKKWKYDINTKDRFKSKGDTEMSTKVFNN